MDQFWGVWGVSRNVGKARVENAREHTDDGWEPWRKDTCPDIQNIKVRRVDQVARATLGKMLGLIEHAIRKFLEPQSFWDQNRGQIRQTRYIHTYVHTYIQNRTEHYLTFTFTFTIYHLHYIKLHTYIIISYIYICMNHICTLYTLTIIDTSLQGDFAGLKEITSKLEEALNGCQAWANFPGEWGNYNMKNTWKTHDNSNDIDSNYSCSRFFFY